MKKIGYAVVGLGIGQAHADAAYASEKAELVAVCDLLDNKLAKAKERYPNVKTYKDYDEMLKDSDIDIISICVPSGYHAEFSVKAMKAGKHVLCEKPIDITVEKALEIEKARVETGLKCGVIFQNRFNAVMKPVKEAIDANRFGKIFLGTFAVKWLRDQAYYDVNGGWHGTWAIDGGGSLINQSVHTLDIMQWFMGEVSSVFSTIKIVNHNIESEDMTASIIKFKSGATATFVTSTCCYPGISTDIQIYGTDGSVEIEGDNLKLWKEKGLSKMDESDLMEQYGSGNGTVAANDPSLVFGHKFQVEDIISAVLEDRDPIVMPLEAIKSVRIINAIYESAKTNKEVFL